MKKRRVVRYLIIGMLTMIIVGGSIFSYQVGKSVGGGMLEAEKEQDTNDNSRRQLQVWGYDLSTFEAQYKAEEVQLEASDGQRVVGYYYSSDGNKEKDTVILVAGMGGDAICMAPLVEMYLKQGMNAMAIDRRGTGKVKEGKLTYGYDESKDLIACVEYLRQEMGNHRLIVHGQSLGGTVVGVFAATKEAQENVDGFILESPMKSLEYMFLGYWRDTQGETPKAVEQYLVACGSLYLKIKEGFTFSDIDLVKTQSKNKRPTMVIGCTKDNLCTLEDSDEVFKSIAAENKQYYVADSKHVEGYISEPEVYVQKVVGFIEGINL